MKDFHTKKIKEIQLWAWAAAILPIATLSILFLVYIVGFYSIYEKILVIAGATLFTACVVWWWWALHTIGSVTYMLSKTIDKFKKVNKELDNLKKDIKDI